MEAISACIVDRDGDHLVWIFCGVLLLDLYDGLYREAYCGYLDTVDKCLSDGGCVQAVGWRNCFELVWDTKLLKVLMV